MNKLLIFCLFLLVIALAIFGFNFIYLSPAGSSNTTQVFVVPENTANFDIPATLKSQGLIKNEKAFKFLMNNFSGTNYVQSGGFRLAQNMNSWEILRKILGKPDLLWVKTSYCLRKEQIGEILSDKLGWDSGKLTAWDDLYTDTNSAYFEGVYYPDTYLIPVDEAADKVAARYISHFNTEIAPLMSQFAEKNIKWTTAVKIASLIAREAAGNEDMGLISGIIWNRLDKGMPLQIDATLAYTLGKTNGSWWATIDVSQKRSSSPYNSYKVKGLPPTPICSPNIDAIEAAINPETTDCLYYLHDGNKQIHCAATYAGHLANIKKYLE